MRLLFRHRAALAEEAYKKLRLVWNSSLSHRAKMRMFQATFAPTLTYGLDSLTLTDKQLHRIDDYFIRFLRKIVGIKASYYSRISNEIEMEKARHPELPSQTLYEAQYNFMRSFYIWLLELNLRIQ